MALLDFLQSPPVTPILVQDDVMLRFPMPEDYQQWADLRGQSRDILEPFEPDWSEDELSYQNWRRRLKAFERNYRQDLARPFYIFDRDGKTLRGVCVLSNIRRGAAMSATIGYWIGTRFQRKGYASAAVRAVLHYGFSSLDLERVEAACQPENKASQKVLEKCGFEREGCAKAYLHIYGQRRDHLLYGIVRDDFLTRA